MHASALKCYTEVLDTEMKYLRFLLGVIVIGKALYTKVYFVKIVLQWFSFIEKYLSSSISLTNVRYIENASYDRTLQCTVSGHLGFEAVAATITII